MLLLLLLLTLLLLLLLSWLLLLSPAIHQQATSYQLKLASSLNNATKQLHLLNTRNQQLKQQLL